MTITLRAGVLNSGIQQNGTEFLTVDTSNNATLSNNLTVTGNTILGDASTDTLNVGNGGLVKDASGNVGIGTATPASKLEVAGELRVYPSTTPAVIRFGVSAVEKGKLAVDSSSNMLFETAGTERMRVTSAGGVSFGATGTAVGTTGQVLVSQGDAAPVWTATSGISAGIGVNQTYSAPTRVYSTTYTNSGTKPIFIIVSGNNTTINVSGVMALVVNSVTIATAKTGASGSGWTAGGAQSVVSGVIPVGGTYSVIPTSSTLASWYELA